MAEQDTHQPASDVKEGQTVSTNMDDASEGYQQEKHLEGLASTPTNGETENDNGEDIKANVKDDVSAGEEVAPSTKRSSSLDEASMLSGEDDGTQSKAEESCGDYNKGRQSNKELTMTSEENSGDGSDPDGQNSTTSSPSAPQQQKPDKEDEIEQRCDGDPTPPTEPTASLLTGSPGGESPIVEKKTPETATLPTPDDRKDNQVDGPSTRRDEQAADTEVREGDGSDSDGQNSTPLAQTTLQQQIPDKEDEAEQQNDIVSTSPPSGETTELTTPTVTRSPGESRQYLIPLGIVVVAAIAILMPHLLQPESPPQKHDVRQIDIFKRQMDKLKTQFPNQRAEVWGRSRIHMLRHLQTAQPTEPVSLILTAGARAEMTLRCLAQGLASAFSSALNASVLHIDGTGKASQDSDEVKLDIDSKLQGAFEGDKPVAVIHRFEELPPGSTLIFYRYCDHENAAYKKTCLIFTVLLEEEEEISAKSRLSTVEEMVDDHLQKKFLSGDQPVSFDRMDLDKYGGLWSRISHLILPVTAEEKIEREGCSETSL